MCKDASLTYLNKLGYNVIRHPRADISPLDLIGHQNNDVARLGSLSKLVAWSGAPNLTVQKDILTAGVNGRTSDSLGADVGLSILGAFISAMGGNASVTSYFSTAHKLRFLYSDVLCDSVDAADIGSYLAANGIDQNNVLWRQYLLSNGKLFVITDVIKSKKFSVVFENANSAELAVDVPAIKGVLGGSVNVSGNGTSALKLTFEGSQPLVFGFKCFEIRLTNGSIAMVSAPPRAAFAFADADTVKDESLSSETNQGGDILASDLINLSEPEV